MSRVVVSTLLLALGVVLVTAQLFPARVYNPPSKGELSAPPAVEQTLRRSCYDCHSNHTRWPWYSRVAPLSWIVARDTELGRKEINFSEWGEYYPATRRRKLEWMRRSLNQEAMPPWQYRLMHPDARLSRADIDQLNHWIDAELNGATSPAVPLEEKK
jgi:hypothetical protein